MFKNSHLRLLMTIAGLERLGLVSEETRDTTWAIPSEVTADHLKDTLHFINQAEFSPPTFDEGVLAENLLKVKRKRRRRMRPILSCWPRSRSSLLSEELPLRPKLIQR